MFQNTADMPGMGNELDCSKKNLEEQEIINQELQKKSSLLLLHSDCFSVCSLNSLLFYSTQFKMDRAHRNEKGNGLRMYGPGYRVGLSKR